MFSARLPEWARDAVGLAGLCLAAAQVWLAYLALHIPRVRTESLGRGKVIAEARPEETSEQFLLRICLIALTMEATLWLFVWVEGSRLSNLAFWWSIGAALTLVGIVVGVRARRFFGSNINTANFFTVLFFITALSALVLRDAFGHMPSSPLEPFRSRHFLEMLIYSNWILSISLSMTFSIIAFINGAAKVLKIF